MLNPVKSDVFTLGMNMLHIALGPNNNKTLLEVYEQNGVSIKKIQAQLRSLKNLYSDKFIDVLT